MLSAKIYSPKELSPERRRVIADGLDIVAAYAGPITVRKVHQVRFGRSGSVNPNKLNYRTFDPFTDVHLFVAPITGGNEVIANGYTLGRGFFLTGVSWVLDALPDHMMPGVVAHEVAHGLGFVLQGSPQSIRAGFGHCSSANCLMQPQVNVLDADTAEALRDLREIEQTLSASRDGMASALYPEDFCTPCIADMRSETETNLAALRYARLTIGSVGIAYLE